jgi:hypothetical protein
MKLDIQSTSILGNDRIDTYSFEHAGQQYFYREFYKLRSGRHHNVLIDRYAMTAAGEVISSTNPLHSKLLSEIDLALARMDLGMEQL